MYASEPNADKDQLDDQEMQETGSIEEETTKSEGSVEERKPRYKNIMHLWEFLLELLADEKYRSLITWSRKAHGEFKLKNQEEVAKRWGNLKQRSGMNYEKLSRALRHYYSQGIIQKVPGQRLVYKFHRLPYEYTPGITRSLRNNSSKSTTSTTTQDEYCFKGMPPYNRKATSDVPELPLTEKIKKYLERKVNATTESVKPAVQVEVPTPPATPMIPHRYLQPSIPIPMRPSGCLCGCEYLVVKEPICRSQIMFPVSMQEHLNFMSYRRSYGIRSVPVSVITSAVNCDDLLRYGKN